MRVLRALLLAVISLLVLTGTAFADWPVDSPDSFVSQWYRTRHPAIDIAAPKGSPVRAASAGVVIFAGYKRNCGGYQVYVYLSSGRYQAYYHMLSTLRVRWHTRLARGDLIGYVGSTGSPPYGTRMACSSGPHLHFEYWKGGRPWSRYATRANPKAYVMSGPLLPSRYR